MSRKRTEPAARFILDGIEERMEIVFEESHDEAVQKVNELTGGILSSNYFFNRGGYRRVQFLNVIGGRLYGTDGRQP